MAPKYMADIDLHTGASTSSDPGLHLITSFNVSLGHRWKADWTWQWALRVFIGHMWWAYYLISMDFHDMVKPCETYSSMKFFHISGNILGRRWIFNIIAVIIDTFTRGCDQDWYVAPTYRPPFSE